MGLGRLVQMLSKTLTSAATDQGGTTESAIGYSWEVSLSFEDEDFTNELSRALKEIATERNNLIHERLISFDPKSVKSCRQLIRELDEQRARIKPQYEALLAIFLSMRDFFKQLKDYADSESFADELKRATEESE